MSRNSIKVALDWTPNTIHTGLYIALLRGIYHSEGLDVELISPDEAYSATPAKRLASGEVDFAICPSESIVAYAETAASKKDDASLVQLQAVYAILQKDASAIVSAKPEFSSPKTLETAVYGSYNARYEDDIVRTMVTSDGGNGGKMRIKTEVGKLSLFEALNNGSVDATWVFLPWEGVEAKIDGKKLNIFTPGDYGVPYGYSPVIARSLSSKKLSDDVLKAFVRATRKGYEIAMLDVVQSVQSLNRFCEPRRSMEFLDLSQTAINEYYSDGSTLGKMSHEKWSTWINWLQSKQLLKAEIKVEDLFTNAYNVD